MKLFTYPITIELEGRTYYSYSEDFPGVYGIGKTIEEAKTSILEAMRIYIHERRGQHKQVPSTCPWTSRVSEKPRCASRPALCSP